MVDGCRLLLIPICLACQLSRTNDTNQQQTITEWEKKKRFRSLFELPQLSDLHTISPLARSSRQPLVNLSSMRGLERLSSEPSRVESKRAWARLLARWPAASSVACNVRSSGSRLVCRSNTTCSEDDPADRVVDLLGWARAHPYTLKRCVRYCGIIDDTLQNSMGPSLPAWR